MKIESRKKGEAMNANQIINMIMRTVMRRVINKGVNMGIDGASRMASKAANRGKAKPDVYVDDHGNVVDPAARKSRDV